MRWHEFFPKHSDRASQFEWRHRPDWSHEQWMQLSRGKLSSHARIEMSWYGKAQPPDFISAWTCLELISMRAHEGLGNAGIQGLGVYPVAIQYQDEMRNYSALVTPLEVESFCFEQITGRLGSSFEMACPRIDGLDDTRSPIFILPMRQHLNRRVVSDRFVAAVKKLRLTNWESNPVEEMSAAIVDPERLLCSAQSDLPQGFRPSGHNLP